MLDPEIAAVLGESGFGTEITEATLSEYRGVSGQWADRHPLNAGVTTEDVNSDGDRSVRMRIYRPDDQTGDRPCIYSIHGGGYVSGSYGQDDERLSEWCARFAAVVISVDYRLAPEHQYPAALDDCLEGLRWVHANARQLGVDENRIGLSGFSAGGGLAAAVALHLRDHAPRLRPAWQLLGYPMLDDRLRDDESARRAPVWNSVSNSFGWKSYLGKLYGTADVPAYAAPFRATELTGLADTLLIVGTEDLFYREGTEFARRLIADGVVTELHVFAGAPHGFYVLAPNAGVTRRARTLVEAWLDARLHSQAHHTLERT